VLRDDAATEFERSCADGRRCRIALEGEEDVSEFTGRWGALERVNFLARDLPGIDLGKERSLDRREQSLRLGLVLRRPNRALSLVRRRGSERLSRV
jgi:hypothetical protein